MAQKLNPNDKSANVALSNANLTMTVSAAGQNVTRSGDAISGKQYAEITLNHSVNTYGVGVGIANAAASLGTWLGNDANGIVYFIGGPTAHNNATVADTEYWWGDGNIACLAVDNDAGLLWVRKNNGYWNNNASANPATGVGGINISAITGARFFATYGEFVGDQVTANFGATAFSYAVPSGFNASGAPAVVATHSNAHTVNTTGSITCPKPAGATEGNTLLAYVLAFGWSGFPTITTPAGWTKVDERLGDYYYNGTTPNAHGAIYRKVLGASEPADYTWANAITTGTWANVIILRITGADPTNPVEDFSNTNTPSGTTYNFSGVTAAGANRLLCIFGGLANNPLANEWPLAVPAGFTRQAFINDTVEFVNIGSASKVQAAAGASGALSAPYNDAEKLAQGFTIAIRPAVIGAKPFSFGFIIQ